MNHKHTFRLSELRKLQDQAFAGPYQLMVTSGATSLLKSGEKGTMPAMRFSERPGFWKPMAPASDEKLRATDKLMAAAPELLTIAEDLQLDAGIARNKWSTQKELYQETLEDLAVALAFVREQNPALSVALESHVDYHQKSRQAAAREGLRRKAQELGIDLNGDLVD